MSRGKFYGAYGACHASDAGSEGFTTMLHTLHYYCLKAACRVFFRPRECEREGSLGDGGLVPW